MNRGREKKESFATTLKKRLTRGGKKRSQSAERAPYGSHSLREGTYLRPPGSQTTNTGSLGTEQMVYTVEVRVEESDDPQQRTRSGSFGSGLRRLFSPSKGAATTTRRGGSLNKPVPGTQPGDVSRESSLPATRSTLSPYGPSPTGAQLLDTGYQRPARQSTPVPTSRDGAR